MLSSRCNDRFPLSSGKPLSDTRRLLKDHLINTNLFDQQLFDVWINEDAPPASGQDGWDACMDQVDKADVVIVLYNGNAGWSKEKGGVGICHGELKRALDTAPGKVRVISLGPKADIEKPDGPSDEGFRAFVDRHNLFHEAADSLEELQHVVEQTVLHAFADLVGLGGREARKGRYYSGDALVWSKLDYEARRKRIRETLESALIAAGAKRTGEFTVERSLERDKVLFVIDGIPASLTVSAAREIVGRPFLRDYAFAKKLKKTVGPVHIIGCNRNATESQAVQLLGFPDATVVTAPFGVFVADDVQKIQFALLSNCRDETTTRNALDRFVEWLDASGETNDLIGRARSRKRIVEVVADELH